MAGKESDSSVGAVGWAPTLGWAEGRGEVFSVGESSGEHGARLKIH